MSHPEEKTSHTPTDSFNDAKFNELESKGVTTHVLTEDAPLDNYVSSDDTKKTARIMRKMDWRVLPIASLLYLFSFLDRSAIGNARVANMEKELKLSSSQYAACVSVFFGLYCLLEVPSNLLLKKYGAKIYLPIIVVLWGLVMAFTGLVKNFEGLLAMRILLGGFEAGLFPGITYHLTNLYPRKEIQFRIGIFFSAATIAGAFGGLLAYGLSFVEIGGYNRWPWIFFVEGILTVIVGVSSYFILFSSIPEAKFLTKDEQDFMQNRITYDSTAIPMDDTYKWQYVQAGLLDWKPWLSIISYICCITPLYSIALTLPTILKVSLKYDAVHAQLMTVPIYIVAAFMVVVFAYFSDRLQNRSEFLIGGCVISAIGWGIGHAYPHNGKVRYGAMFLSSFSYAAFPSVVALLTQNIGGKTKRSVCIAIQVGVGGLAGIISSNIFLTRWAPTFMTSYLLNILFNCGAIVAASIYWFLLYLANQSKKRQIDSGAAAQISPEVLATMGDHSPYFVYKY